MYKCVDFFLLLNKINIRFSKKIFLSFSDLSCFTIVKIINLKNIEIINFGISLKYIPNTNRSNYFVKLIQKSEEVIRRMRWLAHFFLRKNNTKWPVDYGFSSKRTASFAKRLLEEDLLDIVNSISFYKKKNYFHKTSGRIATDINETDKVLMITSKNKPD